MTTKVVHYEQLKTGWWLIELEEARRWRQPRRQQYLVEGTNYSAQVYQFPDLTRCYHGMADLVKQLIALEQVHPEIAKVLNKYADAKMVDTEKER